MSLVKTVDIFTKEDYYLSLCLENSDRPWSVYVRTREEGNTQRKRKQVKKYKGELEIEV